MEWKVYFKKQTKDKTFNKIWNWVWKCMVTLYVHRSSPFPWFILWRPAEIPYPQTWARTLPTATYIVINTVSSWLGHLCPPPSNCARILPLHEATGIGSEDVLGWAIDLKSRVRYLHLSSFPFPTKVTCYLQRKTNVTFWTCHSSKHCKFPIKSWAVFCRYQDHWPDSWWLKKRQFY